MKMKVRLEYSEEYLIDMLRQEFAVKGNIPDGFNVNDPENSKLRLFVDKDHNIKLVVEYEGEE